ncbi:flavodoxin family protein [Planococcus maritimus]|uniref:Flavodoxin family protein n=1 Tax=Planococcus maritimus TaxID=192421 RepID=A0A7D7MHS4_PLAMR|nr:flavodoxin family protein [Planococcus maritimus]QMT16686.1 flavodoxin family protein [Planococcus maritimus]
MSIAVIYGSTRPNGNTETLTKQAVGNIEVDSIYLNDFNINSIEDKRHDEEGFHIVEDDYDAVLSRMMQHDMVIFATPIYWYSMSGQMKNFVDRWSQTMKDARFKDFKERMSYKKAYVIAVGGDSPYIKGLPLIQQFTYIFNFFGLSFEGYIIGEANKPGDIYKDQQAISAAEQLRKKLISL